MRKLIQKLKNNTIFGFILGGIIFGSVVYAASYYAKDVMYDPTDESWEVNNVNNALNDLYDMKTELDNLKSLGDATTNDIMSGKTALVQGELVTGTKVQKNNEMNMQLTLVPSLSNDNGCGLSGVKDSCYANVSITNNGYTKMDCYYYNAYFPMYLKIDGTNYSMTSNATTTFNISGKNEILFYTLTSDSSTYTNRTRVRVRLYN